MSVEPLATQPAPSKPLGGKPKQFTTMVVLVGAHALLSFVNYRPSSHFHLAAAIIGSIAMVYFFWRQNIWARRLVLMTAALSFVVEVPTFSKMSASGQVVIGAHLALAAFLLYWLNTKLAKGYFSPDGLKNHAQQIT